jgi:hypothetical protein
MQPSQPGSYTQQPFAPNPYAQPMPTVPIVPPKSGRAVSLGIIISFIMTIVLLLGAIGFGAWAFMSRQDYKTNVDKKVASAVVVAKQQEDVVKDAAFAEQEKQPFHTYKSPATYGSISITYPKTWSAFVTEASAVQAGSFPVDGYFHPGFVPGTQSGTDFALRVQVLQQSYATVMSAFNSQTKAGKVSVSPYAAPKVPSVVGARVEGAIIQGKVGSMVVLPLRDKTIEISTQSATFIKDFNNTILANLTFEP